MTLKRFLHLERARREAPGAPVAPAAPERFGATQADATPTATATPSSTATPAPSATSAARRFAPPEARAPDVAAKDPDAQPFVRCCRCESDNSVYAAACARCGDALDSPEQRAFNERLWAERLRDREEEERLLASRRAEREEAERRLAADRRKAAEVLARETARRERDRLDADGYRDGWGGGRWGEDGGDRRPVGLRLLYLIRDPRWRLAAGALLVVFVAWLLVAAFRGGGMVAYLILIVVGSLFSRGRRRWRRW